MLEALKQKVFEANMELPARGLVLYTWGNVSEIDREQGLVVIKPSGVEYETMTAEDMVVVDLSGRVVDGKLRPSSDTDTHLALYRAFPEIGGVVHTHSSWATTFAQAGAAVPALGTTHADYFYGPVPCTRKLSEEEIAGSYEENTGLVIVDMMKQIIAGLQSRPGYEEEHFDALSIPAALVREHGPFVWGKDAAQAVYHAVVLEEVAKMAYHTASIRSLSGAQGDLFASMQDALLDKHFLRKHGKNAYYGQK